MGQSTNAILYYGFEFYSDERCHAYTEADIERFEVLRDKYWEITEENKVAIGTHCSYDYPMYYLYANKQTACRGYPEEVKVDKITAEVEAEMKQSLKDFCDKHAIQWQKPKWMLVSFWG